MRSNRLYFALALILSHFLAGVGISGQYVPESAIPPAIMRDAELVPTGETSAVCISNTGTPTPSIQLCATVDLTGKTTYYKPPEVTVANLPANHGIVIVTNALDSTSCTVAGGSTKVPCWYNGTTWVPMGAGGAVVGSGDLTDVLETNNEVCVTNPGGPQPQVGLCATLALASKTLQFGNISLLNDISPATLSADTNDWNPTSLATASTIRVATDRVNRLITGLQGGTDGRVLTLYNVGSYAINLVASSSSSATANRFAFASDLILYPNQGIVLQYDSVVTGGKWRAVSMVSVPSDSHYCAQAVGAGTDAYACTLSPPITVYTTGSHYYFKADVGNTGQASLNYNAVGAQIIKKPVGGITTDLATGDIQAGQIVEVVWDGTNWQMVSQVGNSPSGLTGTLTTGTIPVATSPTAVGNSWMTQDANYVYFSKPIYSGVCTTNCFNIVRDQTGIVNLNESSMRRKTITFSIGSDTGADLVDGQDEKEVWQNRIAAMHITEVHCRTDTGTSRINLRQNAGGTDILSANLDCTNSGATSTSFTSGQDALALASRIDFLMVTAAISGTPKRVTITITTQLDSQ